MLDRQLANRWRALYLFNIYRILVSGLFVSFFYFKIELSPYADLAPRLFYQVSLVYFIFSLFSNFTIQRTWPSFALQTHTQLIVDILAIVFLMHASGGVSSGVGFLIIIPIAAGSFFLVRTISYFYAAVASIFILLDQLYLFLNFGISLSYPPAGVLGMILFATVMLTNYLIEKIKNTEALAMQMGEDLEGMEDLAQFVIHKLTTPVFLIDKSEKIILKNEAAVKLCALLQHKKSTYLYEVSAQLSLMLKSWQQNKDCDKESYILEDTTVEVLPHFSNLQKSQNYDTIIFLDDVSQVKLQAQQQKLASLGRLTASIAHEIRNPLAAISHAGELLAESDTIQQQDKRLTRIIDKQSHRLNTIIDTVLNLSKRHQGDKEEIELNSWLKSFFTEQINFPAEKINLDLQDGPLIINFDPHHLRQIINNLIQNALQHSENESNKVEVKLYQSRAIILDIINYGKPIKQENIAQLFEPFFTTKNSGTGVGLYMAKELSIINQAVLSFVPHDNYTCFRLLLEPCLKT